MQRVSKASVSVGDAELARIGLGLVVLLGLAEGDDEQAARYVVGKVVNLRIFPDEDGRFDRSALDIGAELLIISQFTLYADTRRGRRPSFSEAAPPELAEPLFQQSVKMFSESGLTVKQGKFQAHMLVSIQNDGPVTIMIDSSDRDRPRRG